MSRKAGWKNTELVPGGVSDSAWLNDWTGKLQGAGACLVLCSEQYIEKLERGPESALMKEAKVIIARLDREPDFPVFVLDPADAEQGPSSIRGHLLDGLKGINVHGWRKRVDKILAVSAPCLVALAYSFLPARRRTRAHLPPLYQ